MASVCRYLTTKLRLKVNESKSAVARPDERKFLGFTVAAGSPTGLWRMSGHVGVQNALRNAYFFSRGLPQLADSKTA